MYDVQLYMYNTVLSFTWEYIYPGFLAYAESTVPILLKRLKHYFKEASHLNSTCR